MTLPLVGDTHITISDITTGVTTGHGDRHITVSTLPLVCDAYITVSDITTVGDITTGGVIHI